MQISPQELIELSRTLSSGNLSGALTTPIGMPFASGAGSNLYRAVPQPANFLEIAMQAIGGWGMKDPIRMPRVDPGVSLFEAHYAENTNRRRWEQEKAYALYAASQGFAATGTQWASRLGVPQDHLNKFSRDAHGFMAKPLGQFLTDQMLSSPATQTLMGGNVMALQEQIFANRNLFGKVPGSGVHPLDIGAQSNIQEVAGDFAKELTMAIRGDGKGNILPVPRMSFTRGWRDEELGRMAVELAQGGATEMFEVARFGGLKERERVANVKTAAVGQMAMTMETLSELLGSRDLDVLFASLDKLTNHNWPDMDKAKLNRTFRQIQGAAQVLDMSAGDMMRSVSSMQDLSQAAVGVTAGQRDIGMTGGGYGHAEFAAMQALEIASIAQATGRTSPAQRERLAKTYGGLWAMGADSPKGRQIRVMEYMAQEGTITQEQADVARKAFRSGTTQEQMEAMATLSNASGVDIRSVSNDMYQMALITNATSLPNAQRARGLIQAAQMNEHPERVEEARRRNINRTVGKISHLMGESNPLSQDERAKIGIDTVTAYFKDDQDTATYLNEVYSTAISQGKSPAAALGAVKSYIRNSGALSGQMGGIEDLIGQNMTKASVAALVGDPNDAAGAELRMGTRAQIKSLKGMVDLSDPQKDALSKISGIKDAEEQERRFTEFTDSMRLTPAQRKMLVREGASAVKRGKALLGRVTQEDTLGNAAAQAATDADYQTQGLKGTLEDTKISAATIAFNKSAAEQLAIDNQMFANSEQYLRLTPAQRLLVGSLGGMNMREVLGVVGEAALPEHIEALGALDKAMGDDMSGGTGFIGGIDAEKLMTEPGANDIWWFPGGQKRKVDRALNKLGITEGSMQERIAQAAQIAQSERGFGTMTTEKIQAVTALAEVTKEQKESATKGSKAGKGGGGEGGKLMLGGTLILTNAAGQQVATADAGGLTGQWI